MSDLIPKEIRGRFFARRDIAARLAGMVLVVLAGWFIDYWKSIFPANMRLQSYGFTILFAAGTIAGFISIFLLKKTTESMKKDLNSEYFFKKLKLPLQDKNFKNFILFSLVWGFSVNLVGLFSIFI